MRAMIFAAGLGTRLRPLTSDRPKALVEIGGRTLLEITLRRLQEVGVDEVIVNAHHFADQIADFLDSHDFGIPIQISREDILLDTGGGLKKAADFFLRPPASPFLVHNVDVLSNIDLGRMVQSHAGSGALAVLAVQDRRSSRHLLFDQQLRLCGRRIGAEAPELVRPVEQLHELAFCGVHVISPAIFSRMSEEGVFSIITTYLRLAAENQNILAFRADSSYWRDLGTMEHLRQAEDDVDRGLMQP